jgi:hypothetical protein
MCSGGSLFASGNLSFASALVIVSSFGSSLASCPGCNITVARSFQIDARLELLSPVSLDGSPGLQPWQLIVAVGAVASSRSLSLESGVQLVVSGALSVLWNSVWEIAVGVLQSCVPPPLSPHSSPCGC